MAPAMNWFLFSEPIVCSSGPGPDSDNFRPYERMSMSKEEVQASLSDLDAALQQIDTLLKPVLSKSLAETTRDMDPLENAKLQVNLAYTMNTLYYSMIILILDLNSPL